MEDLSPRPGDLEPIETASRDEIAALQLERMKWSLNHAYANSTRLGSLTDTQKSVETIGEYFIFTTEKLPTFMCKW